MTRINSLLKDYREVAAIAVLVAKEIFHLQKGVGNIFFKTEHSYITFTGVLYVPGLDQNLINCYTAQVAVMETPNSASPRSPEDAQYNTELYLWHQRFEHLASMSTKGLVEALPKLNRRTLCPTAKKLSGA
jgi:hypothetical protein